MPVHSERRVLPYSAEQLFDLVAAVERYPEFLPWCREARVTGRDGHVFHADMTVGFKAVRRCSAPASKPRRPCAIDVTPTAAVPPHG